jgi:alpha-tubulin suppressor-like RCC1 family protein
LAGDVHVGGSVIQLAAGGSHTCALLDTGTVRCWGDAAYGQLGYGNTRNIGDNETPASAGDVHVGGFVVKVVAGELHTCALLDTGAVRCWGYSEFGQLGYGNTIQIGDDEPPASAGNISVGGSVVQFAAGGSHTCALLDTGAVRCWGSARSGQLGYGNRISIGDTETPASADDVDIGGSLLPGALIEDSYDLFNSSNAHYWNDGLSDPFAYGKPALSESTSLQAVTATYFSTKLRFTVAHAP